MSSGERDPNEILGGFAGDDDDAPRPRNYASEEVIGADDEDGAAGDESDWGEAVHASDDEDALNDVLAEVEGQDQDPDVDTIGVASSQGGGLLGALRETLRNPGGNKGKLSGVIGVGFVLWFAAQMFGAINGDAQPDIAGSWSDNDDTSLLPADDDWETTFEPEDPQDTGSAANVAESTGNDDDAAASSREIESLQAAQAQMEARLADLHTSMRSVENLVDAQSGSGGTLDESAVRQLLVREMGGADRLEGIEAMIEETGDLLRSLTQRVAAIDARTHAVQAEIAELDGSRPRGRPDIDFIGSATPSGCESCIPHAVIHDAGGERRLLARGDTFEGFRVEVQPDRMVLESDDGQQYSYFRDY